MPFITPTPSIQQHTALCAHSISESVFFCIAKHAIWHVSCISKAIAKSQQATKYGSEITSACCSGPHPYVLDGTQLQIEYRTISGDNGDKGIGVAAAWSTPLRTLSPDLTWNTETVGRRRWMPSSSTHISQPQIINAPTIPRDNSRLSAQSYTQRERVKDWRLESFDNLKCWRRDRTLILCAFTAELLVS